jgi:dTDP-4-dehydrorhamnose reductase
VSCRSNDLGKEQFLDFGKTEINNPKSRRPLAIIGARGTLGRAFARLCDLRGIQYHLLTRQEMDITDPVSVDAALTELNPWAVVNAAGYVRVDDAEREADACLRVNARGQQSSLLAVRGREYHCLLSHQTLCSTGLVPPLM